MRIRPETLVRASVLPSLLALASACNRHEADSADPFASERAFSAAHAAAACALYERCGLLADYGLTLEGCTEDLDATTFRHVTDGDCGFNAKAADACVAEFNAASCETSGASPETLCSDVCDG